MDLTKVLLIATVVEAIWETLKMFWQSGKANPDRIGAAAIGIVVCVGANIDLFALAGVPLGIRYAGVVLSGILISRGANFVHDLLNTINNIAKQG